MLIVTSHGMYHIRRAIEPADPSGDADYEFTKICPTDPDDFNRLKDAPLKYKSLDEPGATVDEVFTYRLHGTKACLLKLLGLLLERPDPLQKLHVPIMIDGVDREELQLELDDYMNEEEPPFPDESRSGGLN